MSVKVSKIRNNMANIPSKQLLRYNQQSHVFLECDAEMKFSVDTTKLILQLLKRLTVFFNSGLLDEVSNSNSRVN